MNQKILFFQVVVLLAFLTFFGSAFAQDPCTSEGYVQVTMIRSGAVLCVQEQTAENFVADGRAFLTQNLTVDFETSIVVKEAIALEDCQTEHVEVMLINGVKSFCITQDIAKKWLKEWLAVEVDEDEGLTIISAPQLFPESLCKGDQVKVIVADGDRSICTPKIVAKKWLSEGFAMRADN